MANDWNDQTLIPDGIGISPRQNAVPHFCAAVVLSVVGLVFLGPDSLGAVVLSLPLYGYLITGLLQCQGGIIDVLLNRPKGFAFVALCAGPIVVMTEPLRVRIFGNVPPEYFFGRIIPRPAELSMTGEMRKATVAKLRLVMSGLFLGTAIVFIVVALRELPIGIIALAGPVMFSQLRFVYVLFRLKMTGICIDDERNELNNIARRLLCEGRIQELDDETLTAMTESSEQRVTDIYSQVLAYFARTAQNKPVLAAGHVKQALIAAEAIRRSSSPVSLSGLGFVYHHAAFVAAAYAGDVDFAKRALAIGGKPYLDRDAYHKAMTAIWIRRANRAEAAKSLELANREARFWERYSENEPIDHQLADLKAVFAGNNLRPLAKEGIGPDFFADMDRPTFFAAGRSRFLYKTAFYLGTALRATSFVGISLYAHFGVAESETVMFWLLVVLFFASSTVRFMGHGMTGGTILELSPNGVLWRSGPLRRWLTWDSVERFGRIGGGPLTRPGLVIAKSAFRRAGGKRYELAFVPATAFDKGWPTGDIDQEIRRHAPHLFASADQPATAD